MTRPQQAGQALVMMLVMVGALCTTGVRPGSCAEIGDAGGGQTSVGAPAVGPSTASDTAPVGRGGMRVYVNPETGALESPPPGSGAPAAAAGRAAGTASHGLTVVEGPTKGGGVMVDLQGQFRRTMGIKMNPDGSAVTRCESPAAGAAHGE